MKPVFAVLLFVALFSAASAAQPSSAPASQPAIFRTEREKACFELGSLYERLKVAIAKAQAAQKAVDELDGQRAEIVAFLLKPAESEFAR